jgi:hypothetical protein
MICGAEACNLGAMIHSAELRVHFLKSFQKGSTYKNFLKKAKKQKKTGLSAPVVVEKNKIIFVYTANGFQQYIDVHFKTHRERERCTVRGRRAALYHVGTYTRP